MKILFFTPIILVSAIGRVSNLIISELLLQGHTVVVVRTEDPSIFDNPAYSFTCEIIPWNNKEQVNKSALQSELIFYQFGNHYPYHCGCLEWLPLLPGLVSIHDNFLGHLFWSWSEKIGRPQSLKLLNNLYGDEVANNFFNHSDSESFIAYASKFAPMTEWLASMASSVIVHSSWAMDRITRACLGPVEVAQLPYDAQYTDIDSNSTSQMLSGDRLTALTIGHVNRNKRYSSVIQAIGSSPLLKSRLCYRIVGAIEPDMIEELQLQADRFEVTISIIGPVDDKCLANEIKSADIMCCLRWPALESASASTIEAMLYGKPAIVIDTGFYSDLPDDCVLKIAPKTELLDLQLALESLVARPELRATIGKQANHYAKKTFRADIYAMRIVEMKTRLSRCKIVIDTASIFSGKLKSWGATGDNAVVSAIAAPLSLFK